MINEPKILIFDKHCILKTLPVFLKEFGKSVIVEDTLESIKWWLTRSDTHIDYFMYCNSLDFSDFEPLKELRRLSIFTEFCLISDVFDFEILKKLTLIGIHSIYDFCVQPSHIKSDLYQINLLEKCIIHRLDYRITRTIDLDLKNYFSILKEQEIKRQSQYKPSTMLFPKEFKTGNIMILIVDSNNLLAQQIKLYLQQRGYTSAHYKHLTDTITCTYRKNVSHVLLSLHHFNLTNIHTIKYAKQLFPVSKLIILASFKAQDLIQWLNERDINYIVTPFLGNDLLKKINLSPANCSI